MQDDFLECTLHVWKRQPTLWHIVSEASIDLNNTSQMVTSLNGLWTIFNIIIIIIIIIIIGQV
jgi:hypothetical protein